MRISDRPGQATPSTDQSDLYLSQEGETLKSIADKFGISVTDLAVANNLNQRAQLDPGLRIKIPNEQQKQTVLNHGVASMRDGFETYKAPFGSENSSSGIDTYTTAMNSLAKEMEEIRLKAVFQTPQINLERKSPSKSLSTNIGSNIFSTKNSSSKPNQKYPPVVQNLAQITKKSAAEIDALFKKYGLDPDNLPNPPNGQVARLFNDPAFDLTLNNLKEQVPITYENYKNEIKEQTEAANSINTTNLNSDKSVIDDLNTAPFEYLYNAKNGANTPEGQAWLDAKQNVSDRMATLLTGMYPGANVKANPPAESWQIDSEQNGTTTNPSFGFVQFNGQAFNAVPDSTTGKISFTTDGTKVDYPQVDLIPWEYDDNGAGATPVPDWMQQANYPTHAYDSSWNQP